MGGLVFILYDGSDLKTYQLMKWQGLDALAVCLAQGCLPVGFLIFALSPFYILVYMFYEIMH